MTLWMTLCGSCRLPRDAETCAERFAKKAVNGTSAAKSHTVRNARIAPWKRSVRPANAGARASGRRKRKDASAMRPLTTVTT